MIRSFSCKQRENELIPQVMLSGTYNFNLQDEDKPETQRILYSQIIFFIVIVPENYLPRNYQALKSIQRRTQSYDSVGF